MIDLMARGLRIVGNGRGGTDPRASIPRPVSLHDADHPPIDGLVIDLKFAEINEAAEASLNGAAIEPVPRMTRRARPARRRAPPPDMVQTGSSPRSGGA